MLPCRPQAPPPPFGSTLYYHICPGEAAEQGGLCGVGARTMGKCTRTLVWPLVALALAACERARQAPTGPPAVQQESVVIRFERSTGEAELDDVLTITGLGHVTWREVRSGAVARLRISVDELLMLERAFDDAEQDDLPDEVRSSACGAC